jgi:hypothetical protein
MNNFSEKENPCFYNVNFTKLTSAAIMFFATFGCAYNKSKEVAPAVLNYNVSYALDVKPIIVNNCYICHTDTSTNPDRPGYAFFNIFSQLQYYASSPSPTHPSYTRMQARLRQIDTPGMPYNRPPLSELEIEIIEKWILEGVPNN